MLTVIPNNTATLFTVSHPELTNACAGIFLRMTVGCNGTQQSFPILPIRVTANSFTMSLTDLFPTNTPTKIPDGIYHFEIQFDYVQGLNNVNKDGSYCTLVDYDLKCTIDLMDDLKRQVYKSLVYATQCDECNCSKMCDMYNYLIQENTTTTNDTDCGCN